MPFVWRSVPHETGFQLKDLWLELGLRFVWRLELRLPFVRDFQPHKSRFRLNYAWGRLVVVGLTELVVEPAAEGKHTALGFAGKDTTRTHKLFLGEAAPHVQLAFGLHAVSAFTKSLFAYQSSPCSCWHFKVRCEDGWKFCLTHFPWVIRKPFIVSRAKQTIPAYGCLDMMNTMTAATDRTIPATRRRFPQV